MIYRRLGRRVRRVMKKEKCLDCILNLKNLKNENIKDICKEYNINVCEVMLNDEEIEAWCHDGDLEDLFIASDIKIGNAFNKAKIFNFDDDYEPVGLEYNDYIETIELIQDGISYYFPVYCAYNGYGAEDAIAILNPVEIK